MILSNDADVSKIVDTIRANAELGKIFITNVEDVIDLKNTHEEKNLFNF